MAGRNLGQLAAFAPGGSTSIFGNSGAQPNYMAGASGRRGKIWTPPKPLGQSPPVPGVDYDPAGAPSPTWGSVFDNWVNDWKIWGSPMKRGGRY